MITTTALVLAGGSLAGKRLGPGRPLSDNPVELPDGSGWALERISTQYQQHISITKTTVVVDASMRAMRPMRSQHHWEWQVIDPQQSLLATLQAALPFVESDRVIVQPITTLPPPTLPDGYWIGIGDKATPREDWSAVSQPLSTTPCFHPKSIAPSKDEDHSHPFTGLFAAPTSLLIELLNKRQDSLNWSEQSDQDLLYLAEQLWYSGSTRMNFLPWLDLGHSATYSRRRLSRLNSRGFNNVIYCSVGDLICKRSTDSQRLLSEAAYFQNLPISLKHVFPACLAVRQTQQENKTLAEIDLEYVPFPSLAELFLHWRIGPNAWKQLINRLAGIRETLAMPLSAEPSQTSTTSWLYSKKLEQRLIQLNEQPPLLPSLVGTWSNWWNLPWKMDLLRSNHSLPPITCNLPSPAKTSEKLRRELPAYEKERSLQRIHGDLCFNNILAEPLSGSIRLIDPRGEQPNGAHWPIGYGDPRYDLVKLLHSSRYLYDVVVNDLFELKLKAPGHFQLRLDVPAHYSEVDQPIEQMMLAEQLSREEERLLTASLFFSMLPLHQEDGERCLVFAAIGLLILSRQFDAVLVAGGQAAIGR